jgi:hypothetical protein
MLYATPNSQPSLWLLNSCRFSLCTLHHQKKSYLVPLLGLLDCTRLHRWPIIGYLNLNGQIERVSWNVFKNATNNKREGNSRDRVIIVLQ